MTSTGKPLFRVVASTVSQQSRTVRRRKREGTGNNEIRCYYDIISQRDTDFGWIGI